MTINTITTRVGYESHRLEHTEQQRQETQQVPAQQDTSCDRVSISDEARIKAGTLKAAQESDGVRPDLVADAKARIAAGQYKIDSRDIATSLVKQELDLWG